MNKERKTNTGILFTALALLLAAVFVYSCSVGAVEISPSEIGQLLWARISGSATSVEPMKENIFWQIRLPRVLLALLIGSGLSVSGAVIQGLFRNPLAESRIIGISSGASFAAVVVIVMFNNPMLGLGGLLNGAPGLYIINFAAFGGALFSTMLMLWIASAEGKVQVITLLLAGIAINALLDAFMGLAIYVSNEPQLRSISFWMLGSLGGANWSTLQALTPFILIPLALLIVAAKPLDALLLGEMEAAYLGVNTQRLKIFTVVLLTFVVGASVAAAGLIGFVGLVIPHLLRLLSGSMHKTLVPLSALGGAILLTLADTIARTIVAPAELPIGIITSMVGTPAFIWLVVRDKKRAIA